MSNYAHTSFNIAQTPEKLTTNAKALRHPATLQKKLGREQTWLRAKAKKTNRVLIMNTRQQTERDDVGALLGGGAQSSQRRFEESENLDFLVDQLLGCSDSGDLGPSSTGMLSMRSSISVASSSGGLPSACSVVAGGPAAAAAAAAMRGQGGCPGIKSMRCGRAASDKAAFIPVILRSVKFPEPVDTMDSPFASAGSQSLALDDEILCEC